MPSPGYLAVLKNFGKSECSPQWVVEVRTVLSEKESANGVGKRGNFGTRLIL